MFADCVFDGSIAFPATNGHSEPRRFTLNVRMRIGAGFDAILDGFEPLGRFILFAAFNLIFIRHALSVLPMKVVMRPTKSQGVNLRRFEIVNCATLHTAHWLPAVPHGCRFPPLDLAPKPVRGQLPE